MKVTREELIVFTDVVLGVTYARIDSFIPVPWFSAGGHEAKGGKNERQCREESEGIMCLYHIAKGYTNKHTHRVNQSINKSINRHLS